MTPEEIRQLGEVVNIANSNAGDLWAKAGGLLPNGGDDFDKMYVLQTAAVLPIILMRLRGIQEECLNPHQAANQLADLRAHLRGAACTIIDTLVDLAEGYVNATPKSG